MIGKLHRVNLREVWKHEALDFTTWLENNIEVLSEALDLSLDNVEREKHAGAFNVDLTAEDDSGGLVIIENQLEKSNHDHLGKVLTYLTSLEARTAIWIVSEPRPEHVKAIAWLNESSSASFYLVKVEAIKIDESPAAPLLTLITGPSPEAVEAGEKKKELADRHVARRKFWIELLEMAKQKTKLHANISPSAYNWVGTSAGLPYGMALNYVVRRHDSKVELYIDSDRDSGESNQEVLDQLLQKKDDIEKNFGEPLVWEAMKGKRACRIKKDFEIAGWQDEDKWPEAHEVMVEAMIRLERSLRPHLKKV